MKQRKHNRYTSTVAPAVRLALMVGAAVVAVDMTSTAGAANVNTPAQLGKVTVTGTRIKRTNIETAQPITRISRQQIQQSGYTNVGQLLGRLSFAAGHADPASSNAGRTTVNLRNLGSNRNLVLVNGKRWIPMLYAGTNLNTIPTSIVDHIEILQDGASAVYGSDAIAGVVNIITVKNFNGAEAHAYYGIHNDHRTGHWDGQTRQYDFTIGGGNKRGNVVFNATYRKQNGVQHADRKAFQTPIAGEPSYINGSTSTPAGYFPLFGRAVSDRKFGHGTCATYDPANPSKILCKLTLQYAPAAPSLQNFRNFRQTDRYYLGRFAHVLEPLKDVSLYVQGHYDLFDNVTFTSNAAYIRDEAFRTQAKTEIKIGAFSSRQLASGAHLGISKSNPYNPFGVDLVADRNNPCLAAGTCIGIGRLSRLVGEASPTFRSTIFNRDYFHLFAGFNGFVNLFNREIDWDVGFAQNRRQLARTDSHLLNMAHQQKALGSASQCTAPCVPLNLFSGSTVNGSTAIGTGSITPAQLNYVTFEGHTVQQDNLRDWTADISSDVYDLPAGPLGVAVGWEHIDNYGYDHPSSIQQEDNASFSYPPLGGRVVRNAEYAELNIPLLADLPGAKRLSVDIANRWTQFKRSSDQQNTKSFLHNSSGRFNIRWQVINDLLLRASWSQGFRSPTVATLFRGQTRPYTSFIDPCAPPPNGGYTGGQLPANCPNGTLDFQPIKALNGVGGGNTGLQPEKSISRTIGFVYSPSQVPGLDVNADYYKIELTNTVGTVGVQNIVNGCFYNSSFCDLLTVSGNRITSFRNVSTNVGDTLTEGIDVGLHYKFPSTPFGDFDARINGTFLKAFDRTTVNRATKTGFATSHLAGANGYPKRRFNGYLDWDYGNWRAQYRIEYYDGVVARCSVPVQGYCSLPNRTANFQGVPGRFNRGRTHMGATVYHDVHVAYAVPSINTTFAVGVNNLFDKKPPIAGYGHYNLRSYRLPSRLLYGSIRVRF